MKFSVPFTGSDWRGELTPQAFAAAQDDFSAIAKSIDWLPVDQVLRLGSEPLPVHIRTLDALHLGDHSDFALFVAE